MKRLILFIGFAGVLGACGLRAADTFGPDIREADRTTGPATNGLPVLTLAGARQMALEHHPRIAAANFQALAAEESEKEARSGEYPSASLYGTAAGADASNDRILAGGINSPSVYDRVAGGLSISQLITDFGRTANLTAGARSQAEAENQNATATREQVWLRVSTSYYQALAAQAVLRVAEQTLQTRGLLLEQINALATNQLKSELDVSYGEVSVEQARLLVERAQNNVDASLAALSSALGLREARPFQLVEPPASADSVTQVDDLIQTALSHRPELLSLRAQRDSAADLARAERDGRRPVVSALGVIGNSPDHDDRLSDNYAAAALNISLPLFAGGLYRARQHRAELQADASDEQLRAAEDDVIRDVRLAWLNVNNTRQLVETTERLVKNAGEALELATARYQAGLSSMVELSEVQLSLISAQIDQANAHYDLLVQQASLDYQTGTLH